MTVGLLALVLIGGLDLARARYLCERFKADGQFFYGMDVDRCMATAVWTPDLSFETQLAALNATY